MMLECISQLHGWASGWMGQFVADGFDGAFIEKI